MRTDRTLEALYLAPLRAWIAAHDGRVYAGRPPLTLLTDVVAWWHGDSMTIRPVVVVISGERPLVTLSSQRDRWATLDGRLSDLDVAHGVPAVVMPLVSDDWKQITKWRGNGPLPNSARRRVTKAVSRAHAQGQGFDTHFLVLELNPLVDFGAVGRIKDRRRRGALHSSRC